MNPYWLAPAIAIAVPLVLGPLGAWLRVLPPELGLFLVGFAVFLAFACSAALAAAAAYASATGRSWRGSALRAGAVPAAVALGALAFLRCSGGVPALSDVSTDLDDRPAFAADSPIEDRELEAALAEGQRQAYPDLAPLELPGSAEAAYARALRVASAMPGWQVVRSDPRRLEIESRATTRVFGFVDDVAIRVRPEGAGARVDVRSRSPGGRADFGANAARVRAFSRALRESPG